MTMIRIVTPYNAQFVAEIKTVAGRRWDPSQRCWMVPASQEARARAIAARYFFRDITHPGQFTDADEEEQETLREMEQAEQAENEREEARDLAEVHDPQLRIEREQREAAALQKASAAQKQLEAQWEIEREQRMQVARSRAGEVWAQALEIARAELKNNLHLEQFQQRQWGSDEISVAVWNWLASYYGLQIGAQERQGSILALRAEFPITPLDPYQLPVLTTPDRFWH